MSMYSEIEDDVDGKEMKQLFDSHLTSCTSSSPSLYRTCGFLQIAVFALFVYLNAFAFVEQTGEHGVGEELLEGASVFDQHPILCSAGVFVAGALFNLKDKSPLGLIF